MSEQEIGSNLKKQFPRKRTIRSLSRQEESSTPIKLGITKTTINNSSKQNRNINFTNISNESTIIYTDRGWDEIYFLIKNKNN